MYKKVDFNPLHISAKYGEIAKIVIMPGDPKRAKYIAENFLTSVKLVSDTRAMYAYTGKYKNREITIMGSGMGIPSMGIYSYELFKYYNVEVIIRIGSAGSYSNDLNLNDVVLVDKSFSDSIFSKTLTREENHIAKSSEEINDIIKKVAKAEKIDLKVANIYTTECFDLYTKSPKENILDLPKELEIKACEMEAFALFEVARYLNKKASAIITIVDINTDQKKGGLSIEDRELGLNRMIKLALDSALEI